MGNKKLECVPISADMIRDNIKKAGYSIRSIAKKINRSEWTIRSYLKRREMPPELIKQIDDVTRPKVYPVRMQFNVEIKVASNELDWFKAVAEDIDEKSPSIFISCDDAEWLWTTGDVEFQNAVVNIDQFRDKKENVK